MSFDIEFLKGGRKNKWTTELNSTFVLDRPNRQRPPKLGKGAIVALDEFCLILQHWV